MYGQEMPMDDGQSIGFLDRWIVARKHTPEPKHKVHEFDRSLLYGLPQIARYVGFKAQTIQRWIRKHGFPAGKLPDGCWASSTALVDVWLQARNPYQHIYDE